MAWVLGAATRPSFWRPEGSLGMGLCQTGEKRGYWPRGLPSDRLREAGPGGGSPGRRQPSREQSKRCAARSGRIF